MGAEEEVIKTLRTILSLPGLSPENRKGAISKLSENLVFVTEVHSRVAIDLLRVARGHSTHHGRCIPLEGEWESIALFSRFHPPHSKGVSLHHGHLPRQPNQRPSLTSP